MTDVTRVDATPEEQAAMDAYATIADHLGPDVVAKLRHVNWRDTELGMFEEEQVKELGRRVI